jgi:DNA-binding response OmpR family regulator
MNAATDSGVESHRKVWGHKTILIADDESHHVKLLEATLKSHHYTILTASDGAKALDILLTKKIDLALLDVMMPLLDGYEVTQRIRAEATTKAIPVILMTGLMEVRARMLGIEAGCNAFLTKPFDTRDVLATIKTLLLGRGRPAGHAWDLQETQNMASAAPSSGNGETAP